MACFGGKIPPRFLLGVRVCCGTIAFFCGFCWLHFSRGLCGVACGAVVALWHGCVSVVCVGACGHCGVAAGWCAQVAGPKS